MKRAQIALAAALMATASHMAAGVSVTNEAPRPTTRVVRRSAGGAMTRNAGRGPGWSRAQVKRMAKKRRNVIRNRRAHRA